MNITFFIIFYTIMYIKRSSEKEIDSIMKNRRIRMTTFTRNTYVTSFLTNWELEDLLKSETLLNDSDLTMRIILFNINYMNNILCSLSKERKVFYIRLKLQIISYDLSIIDELIVHCEFYAAEDKCYEHNNGGLDYVYLQIDVPQYSFFNIISKRLLRTAFDFVDVTYNIEKISQQQCHFEKGSSQNNENFIIPIKFRLGRNLKSVIRPRNIKQQLERFRIDKPLQMYRNADSKKRKGFPKRPRFKKRKDNYYPSRMSEFSDQRRPSLLLRDIGNIEKQYFSLIKRSIRKRSDTNNTTNVKSTKSAKLLEKTSKMKNNFHGSNGVEITSTLDDEKEATIYIDTLQLLSSFLTTTQDNVIDIDYKSYWTDVLQTLSGGVEEKSTLSTFDINEYESSTMDYNYYIDDHLKPDEDDKDVYEYDYEYEEPMEHSVRWYDYFEENVTFTTISTQIDQDRLHIESTMSFVTRTDLILSSGKIYFNIEAKTDSTVAVTLLPLIETTKAATLANDTSSLVVIESETGRTFTRVQETTIESTTELTFTAITLQSYISEIENEKLEISTTQLIIPMTVESVSTEPSSSLIIKEMTMARAAGDITGPLLSEETRVILTHEIMEMTTLTVLTFEASMIIEPSLIFTLSTTGYVTTMEFITETRKEEISGSEIIMDRPHTHTLAEIITHPHIPTHREITEIRVSSFTSSTDPSIFSSITIENETGGTSFEEEQSFTSISLEDTTILMKEERTASATSVKTHTAFTIAPEIIEVDESTSTIKKIEHFLAPFTTLITEITQTEEKTSAIALETTHIAPFTVIPKISQVEEDFSTKIQEIICTTIVVTSEIIEVEEITSTLTIDKFLTTFTIIPPSTLAEHVPKTSIIYVFTTVSSEVISIIDESSEIIKNQTMLSSSAVTINIMENIISVTKMEDTLMLISTETSLTLPKAGQPIDTSSASSPPEMYKFTIVAEPPSATINLDIDTPSSSIFTETTSPASEIRLISSISSYNDTYSHMIAFPETSDISEKETYLLTAASEILVTHDTDWIIFQNLEETVPPSSTISTGIIKVIEEISKPKSTTTLSTSMELSLSAERMPVTPLQEIDTPTLISLIYFTTKEEEIRILTETRVRNETIPKLFTFTSFYTVVTTISTSEELGLSSSIFVYPVTFLEVEEGTRTLRKTTTSEIVPQLFTSIFVISETITSLAPKITTFFFSGTITRKLATIYSNFTTVYWPKETLLLTTTLPTDFSILLTSPLQDISFTFFSEIPIEYLSTFAPVLPTDVIISMPFGVTVLTEEMHQYLTRSTTPIDRHATVVPPESSKAMPTEKTIMEIEIEGYEEPEKFYDVEYGKDFQEAYEDDEYTDMDESITKWYDYEEEDEEVVTLDRKTISKSKTTKIIDQESVSTELPFATNSTITDATIMTTIITFLTEKSTETSFEIETTPITTKIFITLISPTETSNVTYVTSDISLVETYRTSYETETTTMISEYEISSSIFKIAEDFETLSTEITPISLFSTIEEYTLTTVKIFISTTEQLEWWIKQSSFETRDYTLTRFELSDQKTILDITLPKFLTSPGERSTTEQYKELGLTTSELFHEFTNKTKSTVYTKKISSTLLLFSTDSWIIEKKTSKLDVILETERFFVGVVTDENTDFERTVTTAEYIEIKLEEGTSLTILRGESSTFVVETETTELKLYSTTLFDLVPSPASDILDKETSEETDQEEKLKTLMDEIKRMENREKEIVEKEEEQQILEEELEKRKRWKETGERERKETSITDTTSSFLSSLKSYDEKTVTESIKLLSIHDTVITITTYVFITLESTSAITIEPIISDPSVKRQDLQQEIERLKEELNRDEDKLKKWERQLQERRERFESEKKEFEENVRSEFQGKMGQEITMPSDITDESAFFTFSSTDAIDGNTTHKSYVSSTISSARTFSSSTFKPPVESELFTPLPPTEKITSTLRHLNRVKIVRKECEEGKNKDSVERGEEKLQ